MTYILTAVRVVFLAVLFFFSSMLLAVLLLDSWPAAGQVLVAIVIAASLTWWSERKRRMRLSLGAGVVNPLRGKLKTAGGSSPEIPMPVVRKGKDSSSLVKGLTNDRQYDEIHFADDEDSSKREFYSEPYRSARGENRGASPTARHSKSRSGSWIAATQSVTVAGRDIGGLLYVGIPPRLDDYGQTCGAYIDPGLSVARVGNDRSGDQMPYWPDYSNLSPQCRATYLDWLASGRCDPTYDVGYMFLFFYGLERRFFIDKSNVDASDILAEVTMLRGLYPDNRSVQRYLGAFLDAASLSENELASFKPSFDTQRWEVPYATKYVIGAKLVRGEHLDADWLLSWFVTHPESGLRTPAERCKREFLALFRIRFDSRFPEGLKTNKPRKHLNVEYRAASGEFQLEFQPTVDGKPVPDISSLRKPIEIAQEIADEVMTDLDKLSRYLGRKNEGRGSLEALALLPQELWALFPSESLKDLESWSKGILEAGGLVPVLDLVEKLEGVRPVKLSKRNLTGAADALARIGFGMAPDPRFALRSPKVEEPVVLFELGEPVAKLENVSAQYRIVLTETAVSSFVAHADGRISDEERAALSEKVRAADGLTPVEQRRLEANLNWMLVVPPDLALLRRKLKESTPEMVASVRSALVSAAHADGVVQSEEVAGVEKIYKALGLDTALVYSDLHAGNVQNGLVRVRPAQLAVEGEAIPPESDGGVPKLDASRIAAIQSDTARVSSVLGEIFAEEEAPSLDGANEKGPLIGLDELHTQFVRRLIDKATWSEAELHILCDNLGLMVSGAIETINEWSFDVYDEALVEEYEGYEVADEPAESLKKKFAEESSGEQA